jgi:hypothetical protein
MYSYDGRQTIGGKTKTKLTRNLEMNKVVLDFFKKYMKHCLFLWQYSVFIA